MKRGFSLVELSIVLVILGLLTGGILAGQSLIRAAELRAVSSEASRYSAAINSFRDKYFQLPGDMNSATKFWGTDPDGCPTHTNRIAKSSTCNGDGNGLVDQYAEMFRAWQQLAAAGLIEGAYTGVAGSLGAVDFVPNENAPASKLANAEWGLITQDYRGAATPSYAFGYLYRNALIIGGRGDGIWPDLPVIKAEEAWNIDSKVDDGLPAQGRVVAYTPGACTTSPDSSATNFAVTYNLTNTTNGVCGLYFGDNFSK